MSLAPLQIRSRLAIAFVGSALGGTTATLPAHEAGDLIIAYSFRRGSLTAPTLPAGWTQIDAKAEASGATSVSVRAAYRIAAASGTASGTWANATWTAFLIYRGADAPPINATWRQSASGTVTMANVDDTLPASWVATFVGHASDDVNIAAGFSTQSWPIRENETTPGTIIAGDTGGPTGGGRSDGVSVFGGGTADSWISLRIEVPAVDTEQTIRSYTLPPRTRANALRPERARGGGVRILGDGLELPNPLVVTAEIPGATLADAYANAYGIVEAAETATAVRTHEGDQAVQALLGFSMEPEQASVRVTFRWAPAGPTITPLTPLAYASETTPTVDSTLPTADTDWTPA